MNENRKDAIAELIKRRLIDELNEESDDEFEVVKVISKRIMNGQVQNFLK